MRRHRLGHLRENAKLRLVGWERVNANIQDFTKTLKDQGKDWGFSDEEISRIVEVMLCKMMRPTSSPAPARISPLSQPKDPSEPGPSRESTLSHQDHHLSVSSSSIDSEQSSETILSEKSTGDAGRLFSDLQFGLFLHFLTLNEKFLEIILAGVP